MMQDQLWQSLQQNLTKQGRWADEPQCRQMWSNAAEENYHAYVMLNVGLARAAQEKDLRVIADNSLKSDGGQKNP